MVEPKSSLSSRAKVAGIAALSSLMVVGGALAYITANDSIRNSWEVPGASIVQPLDPNLPDVPDGKDDPANPGGNKAISIDLDTAAYDPTQVVIPAATLNSDPVVANAASSVDDVYAFLEVQMPTYMDGTDAKELLAFGQLGAGWTQVEKGAVTADGVTYKFAYNGAVAPGTETPALFDSLTVASYDNAALESLATVVHVNVYATGLQATAFNAQADAQAEWLA